MLETSLTPYQAVKHEVWRTNRQIEAETVLAIRVDGSRTQLRLHPIAICC